MDDTQFYNITSAVYYLKIRVLECLGILASSTLDEVCEGLKKYGVFVDPETVRKAYQTEEQLAQAEIELWRRMLRDILANERSRASNSNSIWQS